MVITLANYKFCPKILGYITIEYKFFTIIHTYVVHLQLISTIVTVVRKRLPAVTSSGSEDGSIVRVKISLLSSKLSLFMEILKATVVAPAEIVTLNGSES